MQTVVLIGTALLVLMSVLSFFWTAQLARQVGEIHARVIEV